MVPFDMLRTVSYLFIYDEIVHGVHKIHRVYAKEERKENDYSVL